MRHISALGGLNLGITPDARSNSNITNQVIVTTNEEKKRFSDQETDVQIKYSEPPENPYSNLTSTRDLNSAQQLQTDCLNVIPEKNIIEALVLIIDVFYNNPFKINEFIVVEIKSLQRLIQLLTNADDVILETTPEIGCFSSSKYELMNSIQVKKNEIMKEFKYSYQDACRFLKEKHISTKFIFNK
jgi:hypothetical protein